MRIRSATLLITLILVFVGPGVLPVSAIPIEHDSFQRTWDRTDKPVADGVVARTWMWGPDAYSDVRWEQYAESPGGQRQVQYFDKSRMEITNPNAFDDGIWFVTNGLLVVEMVAGHYQTGNTAVDPSPEPANINIAGDPGERPTYADIDRLALREASAAAIGTVLTATYTENNTIGQDQTYASAGITASYYVSETRHSIASPFWSFMNSVGTVWQDSGYTTAQLFQNPYYATGFPITEAYWSKISIAGQVHDVLWQCFERRCLTYTPSNEPTWQLEAGNVGQHYYAWRYGNQPPPPPPTPSCDPAYPDFCIPSPPPDLGCTDAPIVGHTDFTVLSPDPHGLDTDSDGIGCESGPTAVTFGDGSHLVGIDIPPGTYRNSDSSDACYWERVTGFGGTLEEIIANNFTVYRTVVTIQASDFGFTSRRCGTWTSDLSPITSDPNAPFGDGDFIVGVDISPGTWRNSDSSDSCYWARLSGFSGRLGDIISNEFTEDIQTVTISASDEGFQSHRCGYWTKISG